MCSERGDCMAANTTNISIRMDTELKAQADILFSELGMILLQHLISLYASHFVRVAFHLK